MIILSAGMQKSGSAYFYNVINELLIEAGNTDARQIKIKYGLNNLMKWHNNNIGKLSLNKFIRFWRISNKEGAFAVKTHAGPNRLTKILNKLGIISIAYCYRDPRDVLLSAVDHGKNILSSGDNHTFAKMVDFDKALKKVKAWLGIWKKYADMPGVLMLKYEEMMERPFETTKAIEEFLGISITAEKRKEILWKFSRDNPGGDRTGMHFNKAIIYRYKTEMTPEQKAMCQTAFLEYLEIMCYDIE